MNACVKVLLPLLFALFVWGSALAQGNGPKIRSVSSLPENCTGGASALEADEVYVLGTLYVCSATNVWSPINTPSVLTIDGIVYPRSCAGINSAISATVAGGLIFVGPGADIPCATSIIMDKPILLRMSGRLSRVVPSPGFAGPVIKALVDANSLVNQYGQGIGEQLEDVWIEDAAFRSQDTDGIWLLRQDEFYMRNVEVCWLKGYALQLDNNGGRGTPVRESNFYNFVSWGSGDPSQNKASVMIVTNSFPGSDEINEIRFIGGGIKNSWWEAVRINTGQTASTGAALGPRQIYFDNFQIESRADLDCAGNAPPAPCGSLPLAVPPLSDVVHIVSANNISFQQGSIANAGQGRSALRIDGTANNPVHLVSVRDSVIGGNPTLSGAVTTSSAGNSVNWVSGSEFQPVDESSWVGLSITINSVPYTVAKIVSKDSLTLTTDPGNQSRVPYLVESGGYGITASYLQSLNMSGIRWLGNPSGNLNPRIPNTANYQYLEMPGDAPALSTNGQIFGVQQCLGTDCVLGLQNNTPGTGQQWYFDSRFSGDAAINPATSAAHKLQLNNSLTVDGSANAIYGAPAGNTSLGTTAMPYKALIAGGINCAIVARTTSYTATSTDCVILADASDGALTITVPVGTAGFSQFFRIMKTDHSANAVTITPLSGHINGAANTTLTTQYSSKDVHCDGTNCWVF